MSDYPSWICSECAEANGGRFPDLAISVVIGSVIYLAYIEKIL